VLTRNQISGNLTGSLLVALPTLLDPSFRKSILFLTHHGEHDGAMGVILNRPTGGTLADLADLTTPDGIKDPQEVRLFQGGPVQKSQLLVARLICLQTGAVFDSPSRDSTAPGTSSGKTSDELRAFLGYSGWEAGQLEREIMDNDWAVLPPSPESLSPVATPEEGIARWKAVMKALGPVHYLMAQAPDDPAVN